MIHVNVQQIMMTLKNVPIKWMNDEMNEMKQEAVYHIDGRWSM